MTAFVLKIFKDDSEAHGWRLISVLFILSKSISLKWLIPLLESISVAQLPTAPRPKIVIFDWRIFSHASRPISCIVLENLSTKANVAQTPELCNYREPILFKGVLFSNFDPELMTAISISGFDISARNLREILGEFLSDV